MAHRSGTPKADRQEPGAAAVAHVSARKWLWGGLQGAHLAGWLLCARRAMGGPIRWMVRRGELGGAAGLAVCWWVLLEGGVDEWRGL